MRTYPNWPSVGLAASASAVPPEAMTWSTVRVPNTPSATATYTVVAMPSARNMARGSWRLGSGRSLAVNVMTPNPRNAKNVSAMLETIWRRPGYPEGASSEGFRLAIVTIAKITRMPTTMLTMTAWTRATAREPTTLRAVMASTTRQAKIFAQVAFLPATTAL